MTLFRSTRREILRDPDLRHLLVPSTSGQPNQDAKDRG
jgi:hypothetical protein